MQSGKGKWGGMVVKKSSKNRKQNGAGCPPTPADLSHVESVLAGEFDAELPLQPIQLHLHQLFLSEN